MALLSGRLLSDGSARDWPMHSELLTLTEVTSAFTLPTLTCRAEGGRVVLAPSTPSAPLNALVDRIADRLSRVRCLVAHDRQAPRRSIFDVPKRDAVLNPPVLPYVALTEEMPEGEAERLVPRIAEAVMPALAQPVQINAIALVSDFGRGSFLRRIAEFPLLDPSEGHGHAPAFGRSPLTTLGGRAEVP
ncbi:MAG: DUF1045 domain-containing protein [Pseudomonadota bacterium]